VALNVEFLYFRNCPHHEAARELLRGVLRENHFKMTLHNMRIDSHDEAIAKRFLGSPTIRINGVNIEPGAANREDYGMQCRVYLINGQFTGMPSKSMIQAALLRLTESRKVGQRAPADFAGSNRRSNYARKLARALPPVCC
jgi:glutaredoxin